jgi:hypothetical protein
VEARSLVDKAGSALRSRLDIGLPCIALAPVGALYATPNQADCAHGRFAPPGSTCVCLKGRKWSACGERTCAG